VDDDSGVQSASVTIPQASNLMVADDTIYVTHGARTVEAYDYDLQPTGEVYQAGDTEDAGPDTIAMDDAGRLWTANRNEGSVSRIEQGTGAVETYQVGGQPADVVLDGNRAWVVDTDAGDGDENGRVLVLDTESGEVTAEFGGILRPLELVVQGDDAWVSSINGNFVANLNATY
jgi:sugar lactone lactonase YvrE